jgi:plastocyanin
VPYPRPATTTTRPGATLTVIRPPKYASPPAGAPVRSGVVQIAYRNITIRPDAIRVRVGSTLRWTNFDPVEHTVTSRGGAQHFASGKLAPGSTFQIRANAPGVIHYLCTIHPVSMNGTIEVVS